MTAAVRDLARLLRMGAAPRGRVFLSVALGALTVLFGVGLMATAGYLISRAAERPAILSLTVAIVGVRFFGIARPLLRYLERLASHDLALRDLARVRVRVYERIEPLAPAELDGYRHGDLLSRMVGDVDSLQNLHLRGVGPPLVALAVAAIASGVAAAFLPAAGIVLALGLVLAGVAVPALAGAAAARSTRRQAEARGQLSAELVESLRAAPELAVYGAAEQALARVHDADRRLAAIARRDAWGGGMADALLLAITGATVAGVLAVAVSASADGRLDRVLIAMLALLALASFEAITPLGAAARELAATLAAGRRILELTEREPAVADPEYPADLPPLPAKRIAGFGPPGPTIAPFAPPAIALEAVRARYAPGDPPALDGFSLRLAPGRRIALLGPSGAGKSTVANLLLRFLDPEEGRVTIDGRDARDYRQADIRRSIAVAGQDSFLFSQSIRDNVALARPGASDADVIRALRRARVDAWVESLPDGLDTRVGEEGCEVSGGQRQRIALARAFLADAPVLVLDEPTAHLDPKTARELMDDVFAAAGKRSILLITHRPEGLDKVDETVRL